MPAGAPFPTRLHPAPKLVEAAGKIRASASPPDRGDGDHRQSRCWRFLCLAQIGNFATLRRQLGRSRADRLTLDVAARAGQVMPDARMAIVGRDLVEFAFEGRDRATLERALAALTTAFDCTGDFEHEVYRLEMRFGVASARALGCDEVRLVEAAEAALVAAATECRPAVRDITVIDPTIDSVALARELPAAITDGQLFLQYQPKMHLRRQAITSVEALVRWDHPQRGLILPGEFIPSAEATQHIGALTLWTLRRAIADQRIMAVRGYDLPIFLNIAGVLLADQAFVDAACKLIIDGGCRIGFEITETSMIRDPETAIANLNVFADLGISIAIDDYGAGLSSLAYLKRLPASELKIDKLFITQLTSSNRDPLIVRSTIDLAHALEMEVTAEGIEDPATLALLTVMGCDMAQGFQISRPIGLAALLQFLDDDGHLQTKDAGQLSVVNLAAAWKRP